MHIYIFYLFIFCSIFFSCLVICFSSTVYSVFSLILVFFSVFGILLSLGVSEFLAIIVLIVYIGAIAILFLFTVMMVGTATPIKYFNNELTTISMLQVIIGIYWIFNLLVCYPLSWNPITLLKDIIYSKMFLTFDFANILILTDFQNLIQFYSNDIFIFSTLLYTKYCVLFWLITLVLLVTLIGSLVLSLGYYKPSIKKRLIF